jgi:RNA polymerase sigma-70 factor, ECF subfamily
MEKSLIERVIRGEEEAARELYEAHAERIHRLVIGLTAHEDMARECTQLAFVRAFAKLHTFRGEAAFSGSGPSCRGWKASRRYLPHRSRAIPC